MKRARADRPIRLVTTRVRQRRTPEVVGNQHAPWSARAEVSIGYNCSSVGGKGRVDEIAGEEGACTNVCPLKVLTNHRRQSQLKRC